jgi:hypothetical protein
MQQPEYVEARTKELKKQIDNIESNILDKKTLKQKTNLLEKQKKGLERMLWLHQQEHQQQHQAAAPAAAPETAAPETAAEPIGATGATTTSKNVKFDPASSANGKIRTQKQKPK